MYTDGSKYEEHAAWVVVTANDIFSKRLLNRASTFSAEVEALHMALRSIQISQKKEFIFVDSKSVLEASENMKLDNPNIFDIVMLHHEVVRSNIVIFCWIPSHIGIAGNEKADEAAKETVNLEPSNVLIPHTDFRPNIIEYTKTLAIRME